MYVIFFIFPFTLDKFGKFFDKQHSRSTILSIELLIVLFKDGWKMGNSMKRHRTSIKKTSIKSFTDKISIFLCIFFQSSLKFRNHFLSVLRSFQSCTYNKHVPFETEEHKSSKFLDVLDAFNSSTRLVEFFTRFGIGRGMCKRLPTRSKQRSQK